MYKYLLPAVALLCSTAIISCNKEVKRVEASPAHTDAEMRIEKAILIQIGMALDSISRNKEREKEIIKSTEAQISNILAEEKKTRRFLEAKKAEVMKDFN